MASFATPLAQPTRSDVLEWRFPKPHHNLVLTGRSRAAWATSFVIPQLDVLLDAGLIVNRLRPHNVFITHGHSDHTLVTPAFAHGPVVSAPGDAHADVYCPAEVEPFLAGFLRAHKQMDKCAAVRETGEVMDHHHTMRPVRAGDVIELQDAKAAADAGGKGGKSKSQGSGSAISVHVFDCDHIVPCVGYLFTTTSRRLRPEYQGLPGAEIKRIRGEVGPDAMTAPHTRPIFAFLGDTTASVLAAEPEWLSGPEGVPVVITECSFLHDEHYAQAQKTKHTAWSDLEPIVRRWPRTTFILTHFSMRYSDKDIADFFAAVPDCPTNIVVWADGMATGDKSSTSASLG